MAAILTFGKMPDTWTSWSRSVQAPRLERFIRSATTWTIWANLMTSLWVRPTWKTLVCVWTEKISAICFWAISEHTLWITKSWSRVRWKSRKPILAIRSAPIPTFYRRSCFMFAFGTVKLWSSCRVTRAQSVRSTAISLLNSCWNAWSRVFEIAYLNIYIFFKDKFLI